MQPGTWFAVEPLNDRREPEESVIAKVSSGKGLETLRGSLRSFKVPSPVFTTVAVILRFFDPSTFTLELEVLTVKLGAVEMAGAAEGDRVGSEDGDGSVEGKGEHCGEGLAVYRMLAQIAFQSVVLDLEMLIDPPGDDIEGVSEKARVGPHGVTACRGLRSLDGQT